MRDLSGSLRFASVAVALVAMTCGVVGLLVGAPAEGSSLSGPMSFPVIGGLGFAALALIAGLKSNRLEAWSLGFALACIALTNIMANLVYVFDLPGKRVASAALFALAAVAFLNFTRLFPYRLTPEKCQDSLKLRWVRGAVTLLLRFFLYWMVVLWCLFFATSFFAKTLPWEPAAPAEVLLNAFVIGLGALFVSVSYQTSDSIGRRRLFWIAQTVAVSLCASLLYASVRSLATALDLGSPIGLEKWWFLVRDVAILICLAISLFFAGEIDPELAIRKTAAFGLAISFLLFLFAVFENFVAGEMAGRLGLDDKLVASIGGAAVGLAFHPLREGINRICKRVLARLSGDQRMESQARGGFPPAV